MKTLQDLYAENPQDYMALAAEGNKSGKILAVNENDELVLVEQTPVKMSYKFHRASEYPPLGDMIDAFCKAKAGDDTELIALMAWRDEVKAKYPKPEAVVEQVTED